MSEYTTLLNLLADIRAAVGDPTGKLMQNELVERCKALRRLEDENKRLASALRLAADEPNIDRARKIADEAMAPTEASRE